MPTLNKQQQFVKWVWEADHRRRELEALKIEVNEKRKVSEEEWETLGINLFCFTTAPNYNPEELALLINSHPAAAKAAMKSWKVFTDRVTQWQQEIIKRRATGKETEILINMYAAAFTGDLVKVRSCVECGEVFVAVKSNNHFDKDICRKAFYKRVEVSQSGYAAKHAAANKAWYKEKKRQELQWEQAKQWELDEQEREKERKARARRRK
jgi:hypothetical protein